MVLFLDSATLHLDNLLCCNTNLIILAPNTTCVCQPLDQQILKVHYRPKVLKHLLNNVDNVEQLFAKLSNAIVILLDTVTWIIMSIQQMKLQMVCNYFMKCSFPGKDSISASTERQGSCLLYTSRCV